MPKSSLPEFLKNLERSKLLSASRLKKVSDKIPQTASAAQTAEQLVQARYLTPWQAKQLLKGETGFVLGKYRLLNPVGRGGMGHVFRAADARDGRIVAVKVMARALSNNETLVSRFRREIRATQQLDNRHIVKTLDAGRVGKIDFMVMEYVNGEQLDRICLRHKRLPAAIACEMTRQVALGLQHASEKGMVHRDIKPANIMIDWDESGDGTVKLMDMGLVLLTAENADEKTVTRAGQVMGTPDYMSPEQGWDTSQVDCRSDIYSLGCALYRMLTGDIPFQGTNPLQVLSQRLQRDAPKVKSVCDDIPEDVSDVVARMTRKDPDQRFQTPQELAEALQPFCKSITRTELESLPVVSQSDEATAAERPAASVEDNDGTYRQFLKEVQEGTSVDLMDDFSPEAEAAETMHGDQISATIPILPAEHVSSSTRSRTRSKQRESRLGLIALGAGTLFVILLGVIALLNGGGSDNKAVPIAEQNQSTESAVIQFKESEPLRIAAGKTLQHQLQFTASDNIRFQLDRTAPVEATIDEITGAISWDVRRSQTPDLYRLKVKALANDGTSEEPIGEAIVEVSVTTNNDPLPLPRRLTPAQLTVGQFFELSVSNEELQASKRPIEYSIKNRRPQGPTIDPVNGQLTWTPRLTDLGRHEIQVVYQDTETKTTGEVPLKLVVLPSTIQHILPTLPALSAKSGQLLEYQFPAIGSLRPKRFDAERIMTLGPNAPDGVTLKNNRLRWMIPENVTGTVSIPIQAAVRNPNSLREIPMQGTAQLQVIVSQGTPINSPRIPPPDQIAAAAQRLRKTYDRAFSVARSTTQKNELAARLLTESEQSLASAEDYALLQMIERELAQKTRNVYAQLEVARLKAARYGEDEITMGVEATGNYRRSGTTSWMQSLLLERGLQLALKAVEADRLKEARAFVEFSNTVLGRATNEMNRKLAGDLKAALDFVDDPDDKQTSELSRLLTQWQFAPVFQDPSVNAYAVLMTNGQTIYADNGRSLWKTQGNVVKLKGQIQPIMVSMIASEKFSGEYLIRLDVSHDTNCLQLLVGGASTTDGPFDALKLILQKEGFGQIGRMNGSPPLVSAAAAKTTRLNVDSWNHVEIAVSSTTIVLRVNGQLVFTVQPDRPIEGMLGIVANLQNQQAKLQVRNPRVLIVP